MEKDGKGLAIKLWFSIVWLAGCLSKSVFIMSGKLFGPGFWWFSFWIVLLVDVSLRMHVHVHLSSIYIYIHMNYTVQRILYTIYIYSLYVYIQSIIWDWYGYRSKVGYSNEIQNWRPQAARLAERAQWAAAEVRPAADVALALRGSGAGRAPTFTT